MAEHDIEEEIESLRQIQVEIGPYKVITGGRDKKRFLLYQLELSMLKAKRIDIVMLFFMESGARMILDDLEQALNHGVKIKILTGNYLGITQPGALCLIKEWLGDRMDLRFYNEKEQSFHPKAYAFRERDFREIYIGSPSISRSALTSGIEWSCHFDEKRDNRNFHQFCSTFRDLFYDHSIVINDEALKRYSKEWKRPTVIRDVGRHDSLDDETDGEVIFQPRGAQIEALYTLKSNRLERSEKALTYTATGVRETYLATFDSQPYERVLFVTHQEKILEQAAENFRNVRHSDDYGSFYGKEKTRDKSVIFASVSSLGETDYLNESYFARGYFDCIVIDEFRHTATDQYEKIMEYFKPRFLLGLTATSERVDRRNICILCNYNVPYKVDLKGAISKDMLVPFYYCGILDETVDYSKIRIVKGKYDEEELTKEFIEGRQYELIYEYYMKCHSKRVLGFHCSRIHAEQMAKELCRRNVPAAAVYSDSDGKYAVGRGKAIEKLERGESKVILSVDMFNEELDIGEIGTVIFLRPTGSPVVLLQQLRRGLRKSRDKEYLSVLDFIDDYERAGSAPFFLSGRSCSDTEAGRTQQQGLRYPDDCLVDFDLRLIDLLHEMAKKRTKKEERVRSGYFRIEGMLGSRIPARMDLFIYMEEEILQIRNGLQNSSFKHYLRYLNSLGELGDRNRTIFNSIDDDFLEMLETTQMTKSYKMPVLLAFYDSGNVKTQIDENDIYRGHGEFYYTANNWKDLAKDKSISDFHTWDKKCCTKGALKNPVRFLPQSRKGFFVYEEGYVLTLNPQLYEVVEIDGFSQQMKDVIDYRTMDCYRGRYEGKTE